jgi:hypothetical protein
MTIMGRTIGMIEIQCTTEKAYQTEDTTALQMAANLAANTIENVPRLKPRLDIILDSISSILLARWHSPFRCRYTVRKEDY